MFLLCFSPFAFVLLHLVSSEVDKRLATKNVLKLTNFVRCKTLLKLICMFSKCLCVWTRTFYLKDFWPRYLAGWFALIVFGQVLRSNFRSEFMVSEWCAVWMWRQRERSKQTDGSPVALFNMFIQLCRDQLHIVLAVSPVGDAFRNRLRMFPSLINCCTIDWFQVGIANKSVFLCSCSSVLATKCY